MIKYIHFDIFKGGEDVIVHGCNCICNMGAGIALQVAKYYSEAFDVDKRTRKGDATKLGNFTQWTGQNIFYPDKLVTIVNAYTQFDIFSHKWRSGWDKNVPKIPFDYDAFAKVLPKIKQSFFDKTIAFPKIGAGLAHGNWKKIEGMINEVFDNKDVMVYIYERS